MNKKVIAGTVLALGAIVVGTFGIVRDAQADAFSERKQRLIERIDKSIVDLGGEYFFAEEVGTRFSESVDERRIRKEARRRASRMDEEGERKQDAAEDLLDLREEVTEASSDELSGLFMEFERITDKFGSTDDRSNR